MGETDEELDQTVVDVLARVPPRLRAGDTWLWTRSFSEFPAGTWTLKVHFRLGGKIIQTITATPSGTTFNVAATATESGAFRPGVYRYIEKVENGATVYTVGEGDVEVLADLTNEAIDDRSWAARCLDAIEAAMENRATTDQLSLSIDNVAVSRMSWQELEDARLRFKRRVERERGVKVDYIRVRL